MNPPITSPNVAPSTVGKTMPNVTAIGTGYPAAGFSGSLMQLCTTYQNIDAASAQLNSRSADCLYTSTRRQTWVVFEVLALNQM